MAPSRTAAWLSRAYERHGEAVFVYAFHLAGERAEAERLTVAAFADAHRHVAAGRSVRGTRVWLLRRVRERAPILPHDRRGGTLRRLPPVDARAITSARAELARLEPPVEDALVLRHWCGLRVRGTALVLGLRSSDVRRALRDRDPGGGTGPSARRIAAVLAGTGVAVAAADLRAGVPKALASTVPGFTAGTTSAASGVGTIPLAAGVLKAALVVGATAAAVGAAHIAAPGVAAPWAGGHTHHAAGGSGGSDGGSGSSTPGHASPSGKGGGTKPGGGPAHPSKPSKPGHPSSPAHPAKPTHPSKPSKPAHPTHPTHPAEPTHPAKPTKPAYPAKPTHPAKPSKPAKPTHPAKPSKGS